MIFLKRKVVPFNMDQSEKKTIGYSPKGICKGHQTKDLSLRFNYNIKIHLPYAVSKRAHKNYNHTRQYQEIFSKAL